MPRLPISGSPEHHAGSLSGHLPDRWPQLASFWFLYMAGLGIFFPYYSLYLKDNVGLSASQIGIVMAVMPLLGLCTQPIWGRLADVTGSRRAMLTVLAAGAAASYLLLGTLREFVPVVLGSALLASFHTSVLPMTTAVTFGTVGTRYFGFLRMWGTVGFLVAVASFPLLRRFLDAQAGLADWPFHGLGQLFPIVALCSIAAALVSFRLPRTHGVTLRAARGEGRTLLRHPPVVRLLVLMLVTNSFVQGPIYFFPLYLSSRGGTADTVSELWLFMLALEIPLIGLAGATLRRLGPRGLLALGLAAEAIRWSVCAWTTDLRLVAAVQVLHGVAVVGLLIGGPLYLEQAVPPQLRSTGQALVAMAAYGLGSIVSNAAAGWLIDRFGIDVPYALAGGAAFVLLLLLHWWLPEPWRLSAPEKRTLGG